jgi:TetR/AcrR family transcriptional regulator
MSSEPPTPPAPKSPQPTERIRGPGRPRREDTTDVRERLIDAAIALGTARGLDAIGIREIAAEAGVTPGMIAYYFGDKGGLYQAMLDRVYRQVLANLRQIAEEPGASDEHPVARIVQLMISTLTRTPWMPQLIVREVIAREGPLRDFFRERIASGPATLIPALLRREIEAGRVRADADPALTLLSLVGMMIFPFLAHPILGETLGYVLDESFRDRLIEHTEKLVREGLGGEVPS